MERDQFFFFCLYQLPLVSLPVLPFDRVSWESVQINVYNSVYLNSLELHGRGRIIDMYLY